MITGSSLHRKTSSDSVTNRYIYSDSCSRSTRNPNPLHRFITTLTNLPPPETTTHTTTDDWINDNIACSQSQTLLETKSKTKAAAHSVYPILINKPKNESKKPPVNITEDVHMPLSLVSCLPVKNINKDTMGIPNPCSTVKMNEKGKDISMPPMENANNFDLLYGLKFRNKGKVVVVGCNLVHLSKIYKEKEVATPINFGALQKDKAIHNCQLLLRTKSIRTQVEGAEDALRTKSSTDPLPYNKKRKCTSRVCSKEFVMPQDFIDQQRAYFREIDEYELEVEEVDQLSVYEE